MQIKLKHFLEGTDVISLVLEMFVVLPMVFNMLCLCWNWSQTFVSCPSHVSSRCSEFRVVQMWVCVSLAS